MHIVHVYVHVHPAHVADFQAATSENARHSRQEAGIARFDVLQQADDPTRFLLVEVYRTAADPAHHKTTAHYQAWRAAVEPWMAEPRRSVQYGNVSPDDAGWG